MNGLLSDNPWTQIGMGLLSANAPSLTPQNPMQHIQQQMLLGNQMQRQKTKEQMEAEQLALQQQKLMLEMQKMQEPPERKTYTIDGVPYYDDGTPVVKGVMPGEKAPATGMIPDGQGGWKYDPNYIQGQRELAQLRSNRVSVDVDNGDSLPYKLPTGFMLKDPSDPYQGVMPIPGSDKDSLTVESAAKASSMQAALDVVPLMEDLLFNEDGTTNTKNLVTGALNIPQSEGKELSGYYELGIQSITRSETGAAMQPSELANTRKRFQPSVTDNERQRRVKFEMYKDFLSGTLKLIRPDGGLNNSPSFDAAAFDVEYFRRLKSDGSANDNSQIQSLVDKYAN